MKVDVECPGARGGDLPGALGAQPYQDPIRPQQEVSLSICRTDCSVTRIADPLFKATYPWSFERGWIVHQGLGAVEVGEFSGASWSLLLMVGQY